MATRYIIDVNHGAEAEVAATISNLWVDGKIEYEIVDGIEA